MADEQLPAEDTAQEITPEQTPVAEEQADAPVDTPTTPEAAPEPDRGDPRIAMQEERRKRQELEARSQDPNWIYEQAKRLGLAADETPSAPPVQTPAQNQNPYPSVPDVGSIVEHQLDYFRTVEKYPEFDREKGDQALVKWAATLVNDGHKPSEAVDIIRKTIAKQAGKMASTEVASTLEARAASEAQKLSADAITSTASATSSAEDEDLDEAARDWRNPHRQEAAILEKLKRGAK